MNGQLTAVRMAGLAGEPVEVDARALSGLSARLRGPVLRSGADGFDEAVRIWNGMIAKVPALVVQPVSTADVREVINFARAYGLLLSIKGGGHHVAGTSLIDGGLTLDMSRMRSVDVDPRRRAVRVGGGCLLGDVDRATQKQGLATVLGSDAETGVSGLTLGGGFGYLSRRFGWTVDNLEEVDVVTPDGELLRAAGDEHEDLFWALRGGGGNFGVVTRFSFRLHEVGPQITGGLILWEAEQADDVLAVYREVAEAAPNELSLVLVMRLAPPAPFIDERWHGKPIVGMIACHTGDLDQAAKDLARIQTTGTPIVDLIAKRPYVEQQLRLAVPQPKGMHYYWKSEFLARLPDELLATFRRQAAEITSPMSMVVVFQLGGAVSEYPGDAAAFGNRDAAHIFFAAGAWAPDAPNGDEHLSWARSAWTAVRPYSTGGNYINVQTADEGDARIRGAYRDNLDRLAAVKATYDPDNLFRVNRSISGTA